MNECQNNCGTATAATTIQQQVVQSQSLSLLLTAQLQAKPKSILKGERNGKQGGSDIV